MTISKSKIDVYKVRCNDCISGWADIAIDAGHLDSSHGKQNCFRIFISSDYGNWTYFWSHPGSCYRAFLLSADIHYVSSKFDCDDWFDIDLTEQCLKADIVNRRREGLGTRGEARDAWYAVEEVASEFDRSKDLFFNELMRSSWADFWGEYWLDMLVTRTSIHPSFINFWRGPWQQFLSQLRAELEENKTA